MNKICNLCLSRGISSHKEEYAAAAGHSRIMMWLQHSYPIFNMGVDVMRPAFKFKPKYRVTVLLR